MLALESVIAIGGRDRTNALAVIKRALIASGSYLGSSLCKLSLRDCSRILHGGPARRLACYKFLGGLSYKEISRVTELTVSNVGFLIHTGLKTIRESVESSSTSETKTNLGIAR